MLKSLVPEKQLSQPVYSALAGCHLLSLSLCVFSERERELCLFRSELEVSLFTPTWHDTATVSH